uniref:Cortactin-binding protein-2 N-terminal domain-containing protein n=3 Tax=Lygus hesperus TaxID=30085 RepID=A0A0A9ZCW9_LYGHE
MNSNANASKTVNLSPKPAHPNEDKGKDGNYETLDKTCNTLKRNPKMELSKADLLKLLSYLEGELQARDIVIATLKCEKMKHMLNQGQYKSSSLSDPISALHRDGFAAPSRSLDHTEVSITEHQRNYLENLILQHRKAQIRMANILKDAELRHRKVIEELILEKKKHEHDTAQGDDITYGLEKERTKLKQDLEMERQAKKRLEKDLKKISDHSDEDKNRQKQIVLLLLAERKKIVMKYIEERKRSEDLAQILSEEKNRIDSMAEGLEEESKKSLQMEAELEKQIAQFDTESQILRSNLHREEKRVKELEAELEKFRTETSILEKQLVELNQLASQGNLPGVHARQGVSTTRLQGASWTESGSASSPIPNNTVIGTSVAKVVQPTATVTSVPVSGPTTGVARSISPGHGLRSVPFGPQIQPAVAGKVEKRLVGNVTAPSVKPALPSSSVKTAGQSFGSANGSADKKQPLPRGAPPPVPPNKPIVPPKKDAVLMRRADLTSSAIDPSKYNKDTKTAPGSDSQEVREDNGETYQNIPSSSQAGVV